MNFVNVQCLVWTAECWRKCCQQLEYYWCDV